MKSHGMDSKHASRVKKKGHEDEFEFAELINGMVYPGTGKRDIIDSKNYIHSLKGGSKRWQVFLYGKTGTLKDIGFIGAPYLYNCLDVFPSFTEYKKDKHYYKEKLKIYMKELKEFILSSNNEYFFHSNKAIFLKESFFHGNEVEFLSIKEGENFLIFDSDEVINVLEKYTKVVNSKARQVNQYDDQKVLFKDSKTNNNLGELEVRVDKMNLLFGWNREATITFLKRNINEYNDKKYKRIIIYGNAIKKFEIKKS